MRFYDWKDIQYVKSALSICVQSLMPAFYPLLRGIIKDVKLTHAHKTHSFAKLKIISLIRMNCWSLFFSGLKKKLMLNYITMSERNLVILFGSQTGTAEDVAQRIGRESQRRHIKTRVMPLDDYEIVR